METAYPAIDQSATEPPGTPPAPGAAGWPVIAIERGGKGSLVDQIVSAVSAMVGARELRIGTKMPSVRQFAKCNGVSTFTVVESYDRLVTLGLLSSRRGSGYFVARQDLPAALLPLAGEATPTATQPWWRISDSRLL